MAFEIIKLTYLLTYYYAPFLAANQPPQATRPFEYGNQFVIRSN